MSRWRQWAAVAVVLLAPAAPGWACSVCWGGSSDSPMVKGVEASVIFMAGLTYLLLGSGVVSFVWLRRRALRTAAAGQSARAAVEPQES